jgi:hypothetical protein
MQHRLLQSRPRLRIGLMVAGIAAAGLAVVLSVFFTFLSPLSRRWVVKALGEHYHANVTLRSFHVALFPHIRVTGRGLVLSHQEEPAAPPLASIRQFSMETTWFGLLRHPTHVRYVTLDGLTIDVPPRSRTGPAMPKPPDKRTRHRLPPFYFERVMANGTVLNIFSRTAHKPPRVFAISRLRLRSVAVGRAMSFQATLTNPQPIGQIQTAGAFGPWNPEDPGLTPISGNYAFRHADLSTIRGLTGILSSHGEYAGQLDFITVQGETDTPQFGLVIGRNRMDLKTQFDVVVDGVSGDTLLRSVNAWLGKSLILARGGVLRTTGVKGRIVSLTVDAPQARLADVLGIAVKSPTPPMVGAVSLQSQFDLPPGEADIAQRLKLNGNFAVQSAQFTDPEVEQKMTHLSERGEGKPRQEDTALPAVLDMYGHFVLSAGTMSFSGLSFGVPGASVNLRGTYGLVGENLNFQGDLRLKAKLSQTTTGVRSFLLKAIDPLFKGKGAGTVVPIAITGTRQHPTFKVQFGKILRRLK